MFAGPIAEWDVFGCETFERTLPDAVYGHVVRKGLFLLDLCGSRSEAAMEPFPLSCLFELLFEIILSLPDLLDQIFNGGGHAQTAPPEASSFQPERLEEIR